MSSRVPLIYPEFPSPEDLAKDFAAITASNRYTNFGPFERELCQRVSAYIGQGTTAVTFCNATIALMGVIKVTCDPKRGPYILTPSFTFAAGPEAIEWCGFTPYFVDTEEGGVQPDVASARTVFERHGDRIAGILFANAFGAAAPHIADWEQLAAEYGVPLIVDSAAGFGSRHADGTLLGGTGTAEVFSLHATKPFGIGEGGVVTTRDRQLATRLERFQNFGFDGQRYAVGLGLNGKLQEISAAIGVRQIETVDILVRQRQETASTYADALAPLGVRVPSEVLTSSVCFATLLMPDVTTRDAALVALDAAHVDAQHYYSAVHTHPHFADSPRAESMDNTLQSASTVLSLPAHAAMSGEPLERTIQAVRSALERR